MIPISDADAPGRSFDPVNKAIIGINLLVFLYELALGGLGLLFGADNLRLTTFFLTWGFIPRELTLGAACTSFLSPGDVNTPAPTWVTIFTSMFIHGGLLHLAGNMMFLWVFGNRIEERLGHLMYAAFYLVSGVGATLSHWFIDQSSSIPLVGASGAIAGVMGAYLFFYPRNRINSIIIFFFITVVRLSAIWLLGFWFAWQLFQAVLSIGISEQVSVAFWAHVGGFVVGIILAALHKGIFGGSSGPTFLAPPHRRAPPKYWRGRPLD